MPIYRADCLCRPYRQRLLPTAAAASAGTRGRPHGTPQQSSIEKTLCKLRKCGNAYSSRTTQAASLQRGYGGVPSRMRTLPAISPAILPTHQPDAVQSRGASHPGSSIKVLAGDRSWAASPSGCAGRRPKLARFLYVLVPTATRTRKRLWWKAPERRLRLYRGGGYGLFQELGARTVDLED